MVDVHQSVMGLWDEKSGRLKMGETITKSFGLVHQVIVDCIGCRKERFLSNV